MRVPLAQRDCRRWLMGCGNRRRCGPQVRSAVDALAGGAGEDECLDLPPPWPGWSERGGTARCRRTTGRKPIDGGRSGGGTCMLVRARASRARSSSLAIHAARISSLAWPRSMRRFDISNFSAVRSSRPAQQAPTQPVFRIVVADPAAPQRRGHLRRPALTIWLAGCTVRSSN
jgi:hypothetical protein